MVVPERESEGLTTIPVILCEMGAHSTVSISDNLSINSCSSFLGYFCVLCIGLLTYVKICNVFQKYTSLCIFMQFVVVLTIVCVCLHIYSIDIV